MARRPYVIVAFAAVALIVGAGTWALTRNNSSTRDDHTDQGVQYIPTEIPGIYEVVGEETTTTVAVEPQPASGPPKLTPREVRIVELSPACAEILAPVRASAQADPDHFATATISDPVVHDALVKAQDACSKADFDEYQRYEFSAVMTNSMLVLGLAQPVE